MTKLKSFDVNRSVLEKVYRSHVESILMLNTAWYGNLGVRNNKNELTVILTAKDYATVKNS